jgi:uncharacterized protein DUF4386
MSAIVTRVGLTAGAERSEIENETVRPTARLHLLLTLGALAALGQIAVIIIQAPVFVLWPQPTTVLGHFQQIQKNALLGLVDLDLLLVVGVVLSVLVVLGLYFALRRASPEWTILALICGLGGAAFFLAVNPTFAMLYLSNQYAAATSDVQRSAFVAAGEALTANYNGTAFGLYFVLSGLADLIFAVAMLRHRLFNRRTATVGIVLGALLLVPPLPAFGSIPTTLSYVVVIPSAVWSLLVARGLFRMARQEGGLVQTVKV